MTPHDHGTESDRDGSPADRHSDGDLSALERSLDERGEPYARVTIVRREPPVSANVGDRAIVTRDGELHGWIGGAACAQTTTVSQATAAIEAGEARLIGIAPDPDSIDRPGIETFPMRCHSEGVLELFVEPVNRTPELLVVGNSPVARSLARLARELSMDVTLVDPTGEGADDLPDETTVMDTTDPATLAEDVGVTPLVVVASMGQYDARGVAAAILADAPYVGLVASDERSGEVVERAAALLDANPDAVRETLVNPAGVDITAYTPAEIAVSVLAEVVDARAAVEAPAVDAAVTDAAAETPESGAHHQDESGEDLATDPVCGMTVDPADAAATVEYDGATFVFCCEGCADAFESDPESHLDAPDGRTASP